jgi:ribonuclease HI
MKLLLFLRGGDTHNPYWRDRGSCGSPSAGSGGSRGGQGLGASSLESGELVYLHPNHGHGRILDRLQQSDPIFNMRVDMMRPSYNFDSKYRVVVLTREEWTSGTGTPPSIKGHVCFTDGSRMRGRTGAGMSGQPMGRGLSFPLGRHATVFQAEVFAILACAHDNHSHGTPEKHVSICSDSLAALKALGAVRTTSPLVHQCQETLNDISTRYAVGLYWVPGHSGVRGNETADRLTRSGSASKYVGPEPVLEVSKRVPSNKIGRWLVNQHLRQWQDLGPSQRQAWELISGPSRGTRAKFYSLSREQSRVVTGLLTGHNTLNRHLHLMGLRDSQLCRKCGAEDETSAHVLCRCEALASSRHTYLGSFFLEPRDIKHVSLGAIWRFGRAPVRESMGHK